MTDPRNVDGLLSWLPPTKWLLRLLPCIGDDEYSSVSVPRRCGSPTQTRRRPTSPRVRGHRFSKETYKERGTFEDVRDAPCSPMSSMSNQAQSFWPGSYPAPSHSAPCVYLIDPGSGESCGALQQLGSVRVHLAVGPEYDQPVKRYPPHWRSMAGVRLTEAEAEADALADSGSSLAAWPGVADLRGSAHPRNLATWASTIYDPAADSLDAVDLAVTGCDRTSARRHQPHVRTSRPVGDFQCLVCGSRGGEVTLPALWLLGCRLPAVVINGGCARQPFQAWPLGVTVVLLTGGLDRICNEFYTRADRDEAYAERVWRGVPPANRATTALLHLPKMRHRPDVETLGRALPCLMAYAAAGLTEARCLRNASPRALRVRVCDRVYLCHAPAAHAELRWLAALR